MLLSPTTKRICCSLFILLSSQTIPHSTDIILYIIPLKYVLAIDCPGILSDISDTEMEGHRYITPIHEQAYIIEEADIIAKQINNYMSWPLQENFV